MEVKHCMHNHDYKRVTITLSESLILNAKHLYWLVCPSVCPGQFIVLINNFKYEIIIIDYFVRVLLKYDLFQDFPMGKEYLSEIDSQKSKNNNKTPNNESVIGFQS